jgi:hypothetical protein
MRHVGSFALAVGLALICADGAQAQDSAQAQGLRNNLYPKFELDVDGTLLRMSENIRIDPEGGGEGTEINVEDVLGVSRTTLQPRVAFRWRPWKRHEFEVGFQRAVRSAEKVLTDTIDFRDTSFAAGLRLNSNLRTSQLFLNWRFAFTRKENTQIGFAVGLGALFLKSELDAVAGATQGGADTAIVQYGDSSSFTAPTGSVGAYGRFRVGNRWYIEPDLRFIYVKISNLKAAVIEGGLATRYFFSNSIGAELGYGLGWYKVTLERTPDNSGIFGIGVTGKIKYVVNGLRGGLVIVF